MRYLTVVRNAAESTFLCRNTCEQLNPEALCCFCSSAVLCQKSLFERGKESLESEFRSLMTRHTKPVPPILILDLISGDDEMETQEEMSLEHLPESVLHDIIRISGWLVENGRNQGWYGCVLFPCSSV